MSDAPADSGWLAMRDGVRLRTSARLAGAAGSPPIVLVHGWKGSHRLWDPTVAQLEAAGRDVVSFDLRGMGESDKPSKPFGFDVLADDLGEVLEAFDLDAATLVGWSMGCTVALHYLDRGGSRVGRLALLNGPLRLTRRDDFPHAMSDAELDTYLRDLENGWPATERKFQAASVLPGGDEALVDWLYHTALQTPLPIALALVREQAKLDLRPAIPRLKVPVLAAYSTADPYYPVSLATWIADRAADGRVQMFSASAHCTPIEEPVGLAAALVSFEQETLAVPR